jgi:hypothetical protein
VERMDEQAGAVHLAGVDECVARQFPGRAEHVGGEREAPRLAAEILGERQVAERIFMDLGAVSLKSDIPVPALSSEGIS